MRKKSYIIIIVFISLICINGIVFSQEDVTRIEDSAFDPKEKMRAPVPFLHDRHNEKAEIEECNECHHKYNKNGEKMMDESSEDMECSACHKLKGKNPIPLVKVYHLRCKGCHEEKKAGPVMCGECHVE